MELMERRIGHLLLTGVLASAACLLVGLALWMTGVDWPGTVLLNVGLVILMATPVLRVALSIAEYARVRDWMFVATACAVLVILVVSVVYASRA